MSEPIAIATYSIVIIFLAFLLIWARRFGMRQKAYFEKKTIDDINLLYQSLEKDIDEYSFYTDGHPYVWVSSSREEMEEAIKNACKKPTLGHGDVYGESLYAIKTNEDLRTIYYVTQTSAYDFGKLMHYQDWLDSQKKVAKNIAHSKNSGP